MIKKILRIVASFLVVVTLTQAILGECVYAQNCSSNYSSYEFDGEDGNKYLVEINVVAIEDYKLTITNLDTLDKKIVEYSYGVVKKEDHIYKGRTWYGKEKYSNVNTEISDLRGRIEEIENLAVTGQGYGTEQVMISYTYKASDGKDYHYKYAVGTGSDSAYTKISCYKTYKVKNSNSDLINYKNAIIESNSAFYAAGVSVGASAAVYVALIAIVGTITLLTSGLALAVAGILATSFGFSVSSILCLIDSYTWGAKAQTYYDSAKLSAV